MEVYLNDAVGSKVKEFVAAFLNLNLQILVEYTAWKVSVFGVFPVRIFPGSDWIRKDTKYLSVLSPNAGKYGPEKLRIRTLFTQW